MTFVCHKAIAEPFATLAKQWQDISAIHIKFHISKMAPPYSTIYTDFPLTFRNDDCVSCCC